MFTADHSIYWEIGHGSAIRKSRQHHSQSYGTSDEVHGLRLLVILWPASGPFFKFSDTWQLGINTGATIVTFLMVFLIQNSRNREGQALQAKLDELIRAVQDAQNSFIGLERKPEKEIGEMRCDCERTQRRTKTVRPA